MGVKVNVVLFADASVQPRAVVVEPLNASTADEAVSRPRQTHKSTFRAKLRDGQGLQ